MRLLIRLYPRAWRDRYGAEFAALLSRERVGPGVVLDIVTSALAAHGQVFATDVTSTIAAFRKAPSEQRAMKRFLASVALFTALASGFRHHWNPEAVANLVATLAVMGLALLSHLEGPLGRPARHGLIMLAAPIVGLHLNLRLPHGGEPNPVLFAFLVALPATAWPPQENLRALRVSEALCYLQALFVLAASALRYVPIVPALLLGGIWLALGVQQRKKRREATVPTDLRTG